MVDWFAPGFKAGGPIQSCVNLSFALKEKFDVWVFTGDRDLGSEKPYDGIKADCWSTSIDPGFHVYYASPGSQGYLAIRAVIRKLAPDVVYLNHMFSPRFVVFPLLMKRMGQIPAKVVVCPRGALFESALSVKRYKKTPFLWLFRGLGMHRLVQFHATNSRERDAILSYFPGSDVRIAENLPNARQLPFAPIEKEPGSIKVITVGRIHPIKNLLFYLRELMYLSSTVELTVVGPVEDAAYWRQCQDCIETLPPNIQVRYLGAIPNDQLVSLIRENHLFVSPTNGENFGHAIFEALLAGRCLLISDQTPWRDLQVKGIGWDLSLADPEAFRNAMMEASGWDQADFEQHAQHAWQYAREFINNLSAIEQYRGIFQP